jgi:hypothetical protein
VQSLLVNISDFDREVKLTAPISAVTATHIPFASGPTVSPLTYGKIPDAQSLERVPGFRFRDLDFEYQFFQSRL